MNQDDEAPLKVKRRTVMLVLVAFVLLSIAYRYPLVEHEREQTDSYFIHALSQSIVDMRLAKWDINPLSYFGYYPLSYPSGTPFLYAELSELTGLSVEASILLGGMALSLAFCFGVFALLREFLRKPQHVLLATFMVIMGARFIDTTYWNGSARGPISVLMILLVLAAFRSTSTSQTRFLAIAPLFGLGCLFVHHMGVLMILFGVGYIIAVLESQYLFRRKVRHKRRTAIAVNLLLLVGIVTVSYVVIDYFGKLTMMNITAPSWLEVRIPPVLATILIVAVSYVEQIGPVLIVAFLGLYTLFRYHRLSTSNLYVAGVGLAFVPVLGSSLYVTLIISPFVAALALMWISSSQVRKRRSLSVMIVTLLIVVSAILPVFLIQRWNDRAYGSGDTVEVGNQRINDGIYLGSLGASSALASTNTLGEELRSSGRVPILSSGIPLLLNGDVTLEDIRENVTWSSKFPTNLYIWFEYEPEPMVDLYIQGLMLRGASYVSGPSPHPQAKEYFADHTNLLVIEDNNNPTTYFSVYFSSPAQFLVEVRNASWSTGSGSYSPLSSYMYYTSEGVSAYLVRLPI